MPDQVDGDKIRLKQVLINLTKTALKFTLGGGVIQILAAYDNTKQLLKVQIKDTGTGGNRVEKARVISILGKNCSESIESETGVSIGLVSCRKIIEKCGGEIHAYSQ